MIGTGKSCPASGIVVGDKMVTLRVVMTILLTHFLTSVSNPGLIVISSLPSSRLCR